MEGQQDVPMSAEGADPCHFLHSRKALQDWENIKITPTIKMGKKEHLGNPRQIKQVILEVLSKLKERKVTGSSHHRSMEGKQFNSLTAFHDLGGR